MKEEKYMKINIPVRMKNPWFWVGIVSIALTALGVEPAACAM